MQTNSSRARWTLAVAIAFLGGLIVASSFDWTRYGFAQGKPSAADVQPLAEASNAFVSIADHVTPAVVSIRVESRNRQTERGGQTVPPGNIPPGMEEFFDQFGGRGRMPETMQGSGSGFIVSKDGYILTNNHVVTGRDRITPADRLTVQLIDNRTFRAKVIGNDPTTDVALIKIEGNNLPVLPMGDDRKSRVGEWVLAIGNPLGLDFTVTAGIISAKGRSLNGLLRSRYAISDLIQTDAAINPGNSGGPLVNQRGEVIGMNSAIASENGLNAGYGFAIPITLARKVMDDIIKHGRVRVPALGVQINDVEADDAAVAGLSEIRGVLVEGFPAEGTPAQKAGIEPGDVIITADGQKVARVSSLQRIVRNHSPGETIDVEIMRRGSKKNFKVRLMEAEQETAPRQVTANDRNAPVSPTSTVNAVLGLSVSSLPTAIADQAKVSPGRRGVIVTDVTTFGRAYGKLVEQDVIFEVLGDNRKSIKTPADLQQATAGAVRSGYISLNVYSVRTQQSRVVNIRLND